MKVAALYDVSGALPALEAVRADARLVDVDVIVSGHPGNATDEFGHGRGP